MIRHQSSATPTWVYGASLSAGVTPSPKGISTRARTSLVSSSVGTPGTYGRRVAVCRRNFRTSKSATAFRTSGRVTCRMSTSACRACLMVHTHEWRELVPPVVEVPDARPPSRWGRPDVLRLICSRVRASRPPRSMSVDAGRFLLAPGSMRASGIGVAQRVGADHASADS
jgi:hypothetical protein